MFINDKKRNVLYYSLMNQGEIMSLPSLNGFFEKSNLLPFRVLMARECPLLQGKNLCEFLVQMDQGEYRALQAENITIITFKNSYPYRVKKWGTVGLIGFSSIVFVNAWIRAATAGKEGSGGETALFFLGMMGGALLAIAKENSLNGKVGEIYDSRLLRLSDKIRTLEGKIPQLQETEERDQLHKAKDFFALKYLEYLGKKTRMVVT
ncbi:MAG: hypothetical protein HYZ47_04150 [Simkania negevensis]|nr:hypothetical protein [Simkania negevensis]